MLDLILHFDRYLSVIIETYGVLTYLIIFLIIFCETAFVVTPFLPGDSLIFVAGTFAAQGSLSISYLILLCSIAAIVGDTINYCIGSYFGKKVFKENSKFFKKEYLIRTQHFYDKYGKKTIFLARFIPIIRTFAPFVAGLGKMDYGTFSFYNVFGGISWVIFFSLTAYFFGNLPIIKENLSIVILLIIVVSTLPPVLEYFKAKSEK